MRFLKSIVIAFIVVAGFALSSCSVIFFKAYGMKSIKQLDEGKIALYAKKYQVPLSDVYEIDTAYFPFIFSFDTAVYKRQQNNHIQPLQALYYNRQGELLSFHINCYAGGFPNLDWDIDSVMAVFPPKEQAPLDSLLPLQTLLQYINPLPPTEQFSAEDYDYIAVVYWNRFMGRQSKRLIKTVQENSKLAANKKVKIIYVNNDNQFANADVTKD